MVLLFKGYCSKNGIFMYTLTLPNSKKTRVKLYLKN